VDSERDKLMTVVSQLVTTLSWPWWNFSDLRVCGELRERSILIFGDMQISL